MTNKEILEEYFDLFELRGRSKLTIKHYKYDFNQFFNILNNKNYEKITTKDIRKYLREKKKDVKLSTLRTKITIIKSFFNWLVDERHIEENPAKHIQKPHVNDNERRYLTPEEIEIIRLEIDDPFDIMLFEVLYSSGLRVSEAVDLNWRDINFNNREIKVLHGKGDKARTTKISIKAKLLLERYRSRREDNNEWVFQSRYNRRMSKNTIERRVKNIGKRADIDIKLTPHKLRHSFATALARRNVSIEVIQELLGHSDLNTTRGYVEVGKDNVTYNYNQVFA